MNKYRVLMQDAVNGEKFNFAMVYNADNANCALDDAEAEFPSATFVTVVVVKPTLDELLQMATKQTKGVYIAEATL